jgi:predicted Zn-dependent protease with MMP-like domain
MSEELSMSEFKTIVRQVMESLPPAFEPYLDNVVVEVADEPDEDLLRRAGFSEEEIEDGETLLGLFDPMDLPRWTMFEDHISVPHRLWIFRLPHIDEYDDPKRLRTEVRKTVIHELAHHFGWTDRDLERFDNNPNPFGDEDDPRDRRRGTGRR